MQDLDSKNTIIEKDNPWRKDFPILSEEINGKPLSYLDNSASTQKPQIVIDELQNYYCKKNANVHRAVHTLSERATMAYEKVRIQVQGFINAEHAHEIIFTHGTTDAINLLANSLGRLQLKAGDEIIISVMEHHSNIVPWQVVCQQTGAILKIVPLLEDGTLDLVAYQKLLNKKTKLVSLTHISNVLGTINPIKEMIQRAHQYQIPVIIDGAQAIAHIPVNVQELDCDFYVFSGHKIYGPTGVGILYGKTQWLEKMPVYQTGGSMIQRVSFDKTEYQVLPYKFEAGTPNIAGVVGLGSALQYMQQIPWSLIIEHEQQLTAYTLQELKKIKNLQIVGRAANRIGVISLVINKIHPHDIATILDSEGVAIRAGHHCAMPLMEFLNVPATVRVSLGLYNQQADIERLLIGLDKVKKLFV